MLYLDLIDKRLNGELTNRSDHHESRSANLRVSGVKAGARSDFQFLTIKRPACFTRFTRHQRRLLSLQTR